jgi:hypothetical protein
MSEPRNAIAIGAPDPVDDKGVGETGVQASQGHAPKVRGR